ncbi:trypsin-like peptidase domain-containing protein [Agromyces sp. NPDC004153]
MSSETPMLPDPDDVLAGIPRRRVVKIRRTAPNDDTLIGTGYLVDATTVITAAHCTHVKGTGEAAKRLEAFSASDGSGIEVVDLVEDRELDVAVITVATASDDDPPFRSTVFARVDRDHVGTLENCSCVGYPNFAKDPRAGVRDLAEVHATINQTDGAEAGYLTAVDLRLPSGKPADGGALPYGGFSGALVFHQHRAVGLVVDYRPALGENAMRLVPFDRIARSAVAERLGIAGPDELPTASQSDTEEAARQAIRDALSPADIARICRLQVEDAITALSRRRGVDLEHRIDRPSLDAVRESVVDPRHRMSVVIGQAGFGKSTELAKWAQDSASPALLVRASEVGPEAGDLSTAAEAVLRRFTAAAAELDASDEEARRAGAILARFDRRLDMLVRLGGPLTILLDGFNEFRWRDMTRTPSDWVSDSLRWLESRGARAIITTRPERWSQVGSAADPKDVNEQRIDVFTADEGETARERLGIQVPSPLFRLPLAAGLLSGLGADLTVSSLDDVVRVFVHNKCEKIAVSLDVDRSEFWQRLRRMAHTMYQNEQDTVTHDEAMASFSDVERRRLLEEQLLIRVESGDLHGADRYRFVYDDVGEWVQGTTIDLESVFGTAELPPGTRAGPLAAALRTLAARPDTGVDAVVPYLDSLVQRALSHDRMAPLVLRAVFSKVPDTRPYLDLLPSVDDVEAEESIWRYSLSADFWATLAMPYEHRLEYLRAMAGGEGGGEWSALVFPFDPASWLMAERLDQDPTARAIIGWIEDDHQSARRALVRFLDDEKPLGRTPWIVGPARFGELITACLWRTRMDHPDDLLDRLAERGETGPDWLDLCRRLFAAAPIETLEDAVDRWLADEPMAQAAVMVAIDVRGLSAFGPRVRSRLVEFLEAACQGRNDIRPSVALSALLADADTADDWAGAFVESVRAQADAPLDPLAGLLAGSPHAESIEIVHLAMRSPDHDRLSTLIWTLARAPLSLPDAVYAEVANAATDRVAADVDALEPKTVLTRKVASTNGESTQERYVRAPIGVDGTSAVQTTFATGESESSRVTADTIRVEPLAWALGVLVSELLRDRASLEAELLDAVERVLRAGGFDEAGLVDALTQPEALRDEPASGRRLLLALTARGTGAEVVLRHLVANGATHRLDAELAAAIAGRLRPSAMDIVIVQSAAATAESEATIRQFVDLTRAPGRRTKELLAAPPAEWSAAVERVGKKYENDEPEANALANWFNRRF